jgi:hypothetical protein
MSDALTSLSVEAAEAVMAEHFPQGLGRSRAGVPPSEVFLSVEPLTAEDIAVMVKHVASGKTLGIQPVDIKQLRHTHHRAAQLLAVGVDETVVAKLCNYSVARISQLKTTPAFAELLAHYTDEVKEEWADFVGTAANLSMDFLQELQRKLDETPEAFTPQTILEAIKVLADRTGHAPVQKTQNVNINVDMGTKLRLARERSNQAELKQITSVRDLP